MVMTGAPQDKFWRYFLILFGPPTAGGVVTFFGLFSGHYSLVPWGMLGAMAYILVLFIASIVFD